MNVLWIDNDLYSIKFYEEYLIDNGFNVISKASISEAFSELEKNDFELILIDVMMEDSENRFTQLETRGGIETGKPLARLLKQKYPKTKIVGFSSHRSALIRKWFEDNCEGFFDKSITEPNDLFVRRIKNVINGKKERKAFIVHGHDNELLSELKSFIITNLKLPNPIVLREQPSLGRTIIEKFEDYSNEVDIVFVLLTPDDVSPIKNKRRARQNVIFEMGYFYAKFRRRSGKIILIYKGDLEIPSDISGVIYIKVKTNLKSISEDIRNELEGLY